MKKGCFVFCEAYNPGGVVNSAGVTKKIDAQIKAMNVEGTLSCDSLFIDPPNVGIFSLFFLYMFGDQFREYKEQLASYDFLYFRRFAPATCGLIRLLAYIKKANPTCRIIYEIPTYPYDKEHKSKISLTIDRIFRQMLHRYVDRLAIIACDKNEVFHCPVISFGNGIDLDTIAPYKRTNKVDHQFHLISVANYSSHHGYERLIEGMKEYYATKREEEPEVFYHVVGSGEAISGYKKLVEDYHLQDKVLFEGSKVNQALTDAYNQCDMAVESLAMYRQGAYVTSTLKTREYLGRGIPFFYCGQIDVFLEEPVDFALQVPAENEPVDVRGVYAFYQKLYKDRTLEELSEQIRTYAKAHVSMEKTFGPVIDYINS